MPIHIVAKTSMELSNVELKRRERHARQRFISGIIVIGIGAWIGFSLYHSVILEYWKRRRQPNRIRKLNRLRNTFYIMRHGQSMANVQGVISSDPEIATKTHGLSAKGREEGMSFLRLKLFL
jgi:hypothetical protein